MAKLSTVNAVPLMTSDTTPSGVADSTLNTTSNTAFRAFDKNYATYWRQSTNDSTYPQWISYKFDNPIIIGAYGISITATTYVPNSWIFQGSNDNIQWNDLEIVSSFEWTTASQKINRTIENTSPYLYYRLYFTSGSSHIRLAEFELFELMIEKKAILKNTTLNTNYSLDNKTLIHLPSSSENNIITRGIESGKEITLDEDFDEMKYVQDTSEVLGDGKTFTHAMDVSNTKINNIIL